MNRALAIFLFISLYKQLSLSLLSIYVSLPFFPGLFPLRLFLSLRNDDASVRPVVSLRVTNTNDIIH